MHNAKEAMMVYSVKGIGKVYVEEVNVLFAITCICKDVDKSLQLSGCVVSWAESLLAWTQHRIVSTKLHEYSADETGPKFAQRVPKANRSFRFEMGVGSFLMQQDCG